MGKRGRVKGGVKGEGLEVGKRGRVRGGKEGNFYDAKWIIFCDWCCTRVREIDHVRCKKETEYQSFKKPLNQIVSEQKLNTWCLLQFKVGYILEGSGFGNNEWSS